MNKLELMNIKMNTEEELQHIVTWVTSLPALKKLKLSRVYHSKYVNEIINYEPTSLSPCSSGRMAVYDKIFIITSNCETSRNIVAIIIIIFI